MKLKEVIDCYIMFMGKAPPSPRIIDKKWVLVGVGAYPSNYTISLLGLTGWPEYLVSPEKIK